MCYKNNSPSSCLTSRHKKRSTEALPYPFYTLKVLKTLRVLVVYTFFGTINGALYSRLKYLSASGSLTNFSFFGSKVRTLPVR